METDKIDKIVKSRKEMHLVFRVGIGFIELIEHGKIGELICSLLALGYLYILNWGLGNLTNLGRQFFFGNVTYDYI